MLIPLAASSTARPRVRKPSARSPLVPRNTPAHMAGMLRLALAAVLLATSAAADAVDWRSARWGMDAAALDRAVPGLRTLDPPWTYGSGLSAPSSVSAFHSSACRGSAIPLRPEGGGGT